MRTRIMSARRGRIKVYIRCKIQENSTVTTQTQEFDNIDPIHKSHAHWEFNDTVLIQSVWVDLWDNKSGRVRY